MARAIDGELLELEIANIANKLAKSDAQKALMGRVMYCVEHMPTLTPPNEWVNRVRELDELYTKLQIVTGFTAEQLLEIFAAGYTLEKPDYSKKFAEMENLAEAAQPNEPLTWNELGNMVGKPVYIVELEDGESCWVLVHTVDDIKALFVSAFNQYDYGNRELYGQTWLAYRRPPEVSP